MRTILWDPVVLRGLVAVLLAGLTFSSVGYMLTITQSLMFAVELVHSLLAGALLGALAESLLSFVPMQVVTFLYVTFISVLMAELLERRVSRDFAIAIVASISAVITLASLTYLVYVTPMGVPRALGAIWGVVLLVSPTDLGYLALAATVTILVATVFSLELKFISFDPDLALVSGLNVKAYYYLAYASVSLSLSAAVKVFGAVTTTVLLVTPSVLAANVLKRIELPLLAALSIVLMLLGYATSLVIKIQTSLCLSVVSFMAVALAVCWRWLRDRRPLP